MYSHRSIQVVKKSIFLCCIAAAFLVSCGGNSDSKNPEQTQAQAILPADTTQAKDVTAEERVVRELHYSGTVGQKTSYKLVQTDDINQDGQAAQMMTSIYYTKIIKEIKKDGIVDMNVRIDSIRMKSRYPNPATPGATSENTYNSQDSAARKNEQFRQYNGIVGEDVRMLVNAKGKIEEISGLTPILNKILGYQKDSVPQRTKDQLLEQIRYQLFQIPLQNEYQTFPDNGKVDSTQTWVHSDVSALSGVFKVKNSINYSISSVKNIRGRKAAAIKALLTAEITNPKVEQGTAKFTLNESSITGGGESLIDLETGMTIYKRNTIVTTIDATLVDAKTKQNQRARQVLTTTITIELLK
jgi:hypothetical protein